MAIYDRDATPATAVTAFLAQFKIDASGDITFVSGTDTFHVWWLHRALQKIAWDFTITGDDEINLSKPNPSTSEALGTIISLLDWTTDFTVRYNITDTVATYLFGGSVSQFNASAQAQLYSGLKVVGAVETGTEIQIIQNGATLTSHWSTGKNQTESGTLLRIIVKSIDAGVEIDNQDIVVKAHEWGDTNAFWEQGLGLAEGVAAITTGADPQNDTALITVDAYTITPSEGYFLLDLDGLGNKPYLGEWDYGIYNKKALYEFVKALLVRGTTNTLFGVDGDLWTNRVFDCVITPGTGTWVQNETLSWGTGATAGTGHLMGVDTLTGTATVRLILHLDTGVFPAAALLITGGGAATGTVSGTPDKLVVFPTHLGQFTGNWIGAYGIGFKSTQIGSSDSFISLNGDAVTPPNNVSVSVTVEVGLTGDDPHVFLAPKDPVLAGPDYTVYTVITQSSGSATITVNEAIDSDQPQDGWVLVLPTGATTYVPYHYSSWTGSIFTLDITDHPGGTAEAFTNTDPAFVAILYIEATGGGTTKVASNSLIYTSDIAVVGWVRNGDPATPDKPVSISGTIGSAGFSTTVVLDDET